jgi:hypothetical protein
MTFELFYYLEDGRGGDRQLVGHVFGHGEESTYGIPHIPCLSRKGTKHPVEDLDILELPSPATLGKQGQYVSESVTRTFSIEASDCGEPPNRSNCEIHTVDVQDSINPFHSYYRAGVGKKRLSQKEKDALTEAAEGNTLWAARIGFAGTLAGAGGAIPAAWLVAAGATGTLLCPPCVVAGIVGGVVAGGLAWYATEQTALVKDPPDPRFKVIARPANARPKRVSRRRGVSARASKTLNALAANIARQAGLAAVVLTSVERAGGALKAGDEHWERRQMLAAAGYASQLASLIDELPSVQSAARRAIAASTFPRIRPPLSEARRYIRQVKARGLPPKMKKALIRAGATKADLAAVRALIENSKPSDLVSTFPDSLVDPRLVEDTRAAATAFRSFATRVNANPLEGQ